MKKHFLLIATILWIGFIFGQSLQSGPTSGQISGVFVQAIYQLFENLNITIDITLLSLWVRKLAHVFEFFVLGVLMVLTLQAYMINKVRVIIYSFASSVFVAMIDELIQTMIPQRAGTVIDVAIDTIGIIFGILLVLLIQYWIEKRKIKMKK